MVVTPGARELVLRAVRSWLVVSFAAGGFIALHSYGDYGRLRLGFALSVTVWSLWFVLARRRPLFARVSGTAPSYGEHEVVVEELSKTLRRALAPVPIATLLLASGMLGASLLTGRDTLAAGAVAGVIAGFGTSRLWLASRFALYARRDGRVMVRAGGDMRDAREWLRVR
jgi:hypothetical protein